MRTSIHLISLLLGLCACGARNEPHSTTSDARVSGKTNDIVVFDAQSTSDIRMTSLERVDDSQSYAFGQLKIRIKSGRIWDTKSTVNFYVENFDKNTSFLNDFYENAYAIDGAELKDHDKVDGAPYSGASQVGVPVPTVYIRLLAIRYTTTSGKEINYSFKQKD